MLITLMLTLRMTQRARRGQAASLIRLFLIGYASRDDEETKMLNHS